METMETNVIDITGKKFDISIIKKLNTLLLQYSDTRETKYLKDFSLLKTTKKLNPKFVIRDIVVSFIQSTVEICCQSNRLHKLVFVFREEGDVQKFEFSNHMTLTNDITTLCFLKHALLTSLRQYETVQKLISLFSNKYRICSGEGNDTEATQEQDEITLDKITDSFPSITSDMTLHLLWWDNGFFETFSDFNVPKLIFLPSTLRLLPQLINQQLPVAILLVGVLRLCKRNDEKYKTLNLWNSFNHILQLHATQSFPQRLKLDLCTKWQIVIMENGIYKFSPSFEAYREKAKNVIAEMKSDDPYLQLILSKI